MKPQRQYETVLPWHLPAATDANDLQRILALPTRPPVDCEREPGKRRWSPEAQALVELVTEKYSRGRRLSCACQNRTVRLEADGRLVIYREGHPDATPYPPILTTVRDYMRENPRDKDVPRLEVGEEVKLPGLGKFFCVTELNPVQAWILRELPKAGGIFGMISVGGGKSFAGILAPMAVPDCQTAILLAKPDQRLHYRNAYYQLREHFHVPSMIFDGNRDDGESIVTDTPRPTLRFVPYSLLSNPKSTELLESYAPDTIIADESHLLASKTSARTMRFLRYMAKRNSESFGLRKGIIFCNWSGSTVKKSLKDASHLAAHSLGTGSPYPLNPQVVEEWAAVLDPSVRPDFYSDTAKALYKQFGTPLPERRDNGAEVFFGGGDADEVRRGHRDRVVETPGVISTRSSSSTASISIKLRKPGALPAKVREALLGVRNEAVRPDGEELVEASEIALTARNVGSGYHYYWAYPKAKDEDLVPGGRIERWFAARKAWNKELRVKLRDGERHLDSPKLCETAAERAWRKPRYEGPLPVWPATSWLEWNDIKSTVEPDPRVKWVDDWLARDAAEWAKEHRGIVWCVSSAFGRRVAELAGINYHGGGADAEERILAEDGKRSIVASLKAHGESRDGLQYKFAEQLFAEIMPGGDRWEQALGRLARQGQSADEILTWVYLHVEENLDAFRKALMYAQFIEATTPNRQLLLAADIEFDV